MRIRVERVKSREMLLQTSVSFASKPEWRALRVPIGADGLARVNVGEVELALRPAANKKSVSIDVVGGFAAGTDAQISAASFR
jgi:hypothetical protein